MGDAHNEIAVGLHFETIAVVAGGTRCPKSFTVLVVKNEVAVTLHCQPGCTFLIGQTLAGQQVVAAGERSVANFDGGGRRHRVHDVPNH